MVFPSTIIDFIAAGLSAKEKKRRKRSFPKRAFLRQVSCQGAGICFPFSCNSPSTRLYQGVPEKHQVQEGSTWLYFKIQPRPGVPEGGRTVAASDFKKVVSGPDPVAHCSGES